MANEAQIEGRNIAVGSQFMTLLSTQIRLLLLAKKTRAIFVVQLLPVLAALIFVVFESVDGLTLFSGIVDFVVLPWLVPLASIFFGGPAIVEEMEQRTLTYLTLRPVPKAALYVGKTLAAMLVSLPVVLVPILLLFVVCLAQSPDLGVAAESFGKTLGAITVGTAAYTAVFSMLGAAFASGLLASIVFFVFFEIVLGFLPVIEMASLRYYIRTTAEMVSSDPGPFYQLVNAKPVVLEWYYGVAILAIVGLGATVIGAFVFKERQYHV